LGGGGRREEEEDEKEEASKGPLSRFQSCCHLFEKSMKRILREVNEANPSRSLRDFHL
jgi:hypothetical protein